jgi:formylmethanofuran dehydrogenase subunit B
MVAAIAGSAAPLDAAIAAAARLLGASRAPLIAGLGTDHMGAVAAVALAQRLGAVLDPMHADALLAELDAAAAGWIGTTPLVAHAQADVALLIGPGAHLPPGRQRRATVALSPAKGAEAAEATIPGPPSVTLGLLRALLAGRPVALPPTRRAALQAAAEILRGARYGVAVWCAGALEPLAVEQAAGLVRDLNAATRWAALPLAPPDNAPGVMAAMVAHCGAPLGAAFAHGGAAYDPWTNHAARLVDADETDAVLWISALRPHAPDWAARVPMVALCARATRFRHPPAVLIEVGCPGIDHDAVLHDPALGQLAAPTATHPSDAPRAADVLARIMAAHAGAAEAV